MLDILRRTVGGQNDLFSRVIQRIERMEKFLLRCDLSGDKLNVVDQQHVGIAVFFLEFRGRFLFDRADELVCEVLSLDKDDIEIRSCPLDLVCDRFHQVGFSEAAGSV